AKPESKKGVHLPHQIQSKSILDKIASDPNIIERSSEEGKLLKNKEAEAEAAQPEASMPAPDPKLRPLKDGEFTLYKSGDGCDQCAGNGYIGRLGIYEVLEVSEQLQQMITSHATSEDIQKQAIQSGMLTMQQDGFLKSLRGLTTIEEILRVTRE
ncbi:MAG TPA: hypothetical protein VMR98_05580, partial [Candidatus Polarisedimenticolaceae bacterium]|nr:hypothetical protein [Candidatus Polarisedimenticolaceae bacterium]